MPITVKHNPGAAAFGVPSYYAGQEDLRRYMDKMAQQQAEMMAKMQMNREDNAVKISMQDAQIGAHQQAQVMGHQQDLQKMGLNAQLQNKAAQDQFQFRADQEKFQQKEIAARQQEQIAAMAARQKEELEAREKAAEEARKAKEAAEEAQKKEDAQRFREERESYHSAEEHPGESDYNIGVQEALKTHDFSQSQQQLLKDIEKERRAIAGSGLGLEEKKREIEKLQDKKYAIYPSVKRPTFEEEIAANIKEDGDYAYERQADGRIVRKIGTKLDHHDKDMSHYKDTYEANVKVDGVSHSEAVARADDALARKRHERAWDSLDAKLEKDGKEYKERQKILMEKIGPYESKYTPSNPSATQATGTKERPAPAGSTPSRPAPEGQAQPTVQPAAEQQVQPGQQQPQGQPLVMPPHLTPKAGAVYRWMAGDKSGGYTQAEIDKANAGLPPAIVEAQRGAVAPKPKVIASTHAGNYEVVDLGQGAVARLPGGQVKEFANVQEAEAAVKQAYDADPERNIAYKDYQGRDYSVVQVNDYYKVKTPYGEVTAANREAADNAIKRAKAEEGMELVGVYKGKDVYKSGAASKEAVDIHNKLNGFSPPALDSKGVPKQEHNFKVFKPQPKDVQEATGIAGFIKPGSRLFEKPNTDYIPVVASDKDASKLPGGTVYAVIENGKLRKKQLPPDEEPIPISTPREY